MSLVIPSLHGLLDDGDSPTGPAPVFFFGVNLSGAENEFPTWPSYAEMAYWKQNGVTAFRLPLHWEVIQLVLGGPLNTTSTSYSGPNASGVSYMDCISQVLANAKALGCRVLIDVHGNGRYQSRRVGADGPTVSQFVNLWTRLSTYFRADPSFSAISGYDLMNEWHDMDPGSSADSTTYSRNLIANCNQSVITALRAAGDTTCIHVEGDHYSGAWDWVPNNGAWAAALIDPANNLIFHVHCYLDRDSSGTHFAYDVEAASPGYAPPGLSTGPNIGPQRMAAVVAWAEANGKRLCLGEVGWGNDYPTPNNYLARENSAGWNTTGYNMLAFCQTHKVQVYLWGAGPGFPLSYSYNPEPANLGSREQPDFSPTGLQGPQMTVIRQFTGYTGAQPTSYGLDLPFQSTAGGGRVTLYGTPGQPMGEPAGAPGVTYYRFRVRYNGVLAAPATITPFAKLADGVTNANATFNPSFVTIPAGTNPIAEFTCTPNEAKTMRIGAANNMGWSNPPLQAISSINDSYHQIGDDVAAPIFALRREYTPYVGPAVMLRRSDGATQDFYFDNIGNLPRQAIQDWANNRSIALAIHYDQSNVGRHAVRNGGRGFPSLLLQNAAGYPEVFFPDDNGAGMDFGFDVKLVPTITLMSRAYPRQVDAFIRQDYYAGPFIFTLTNFNIIDPRDQGSGLPGTGFNKQVTQAPILNEWHSYAGVFSANTANGLKVYRDHVLQAQTDTTGPYTELHTAFDFGNDALTQFGWFQYYSQSHYPGSYQNLRCWYRPRTAAELALFDNADATYYGTPLPDTLGPVAPNISGAQSRNVVAGKMVKPFSTLLVEDSGGGSPSIVISSTGPGGTLTGTGLTGSGPWNMAAASPSTITSQMRDLIWTPSGAVGTSTTFSITASNGSSSMNNGTVVTVVAAAPAETPYAAPSGTWTPTSYRGVNIAGGENQYPASSGYNYAYPRPEEIAYAKSKGAGLIRMPLDLRRLQPTSYGALDPASRNDEPACLYENFPQGSQTNLLAIKRVLDDCYTRGMYVVLEPHNYGFITDTFISTVRAIGIDAEGTAQFVDFWTRLATKFKNYPNVVWNLMNEPFAQSAADWKTGAVAAINAIAAVTTARRVLIPGTSYTGAHSWVSSGNAAAWAGYVPPTGLPISFDVHQYLDSDSSGTHTTCSVGVGSSRLTAFANWATTNGFTGFLGEFGWTSDSSCDSEAVSFVNYLTANPTVWLGGAYWNMGSYLFYGSYALSVQPSGYPSGPLVDKQEMAKVSAWMKGQNAVPVGQAAGAHRYWRLITDRVYPTSAVVTGLHKVVFRTVSGGPQVADPNAGAVAISVQPVAAPQYGTNKLIDNTTGDGGPGNGTGDAALWYRDGVNGYNFNAGYAGGQHPTIEVLFDLGAAKSIVEIQLKPFQQGWSAGYNIPPTDYSIAYSDTGMFGPWTTVVDVAGATWGVEGNATPNTHTITNVAPYVATTVAGATAPLRTAATLNRIGWHVNDSNTGGNDLSGQDNLRLCTQGDIALAGTNYSGLVLSFDRYARIGDRARMATSTTLRAVLINEARTAFVPITFAGARDLKLRAGDSDVHCDEIPASAFGLSQFTPGMVFHYKAIEQIPSGHDSHLMNNYIADGFIINSGFNLSPLDDVNGFTGSGGTITAATCFRPHVLGRPIGGDPLSLVGVTDSIFASGGGQEAPFNGIGDGTTRGGWGVRSCQSVSGGKISCFNLSTDGGSFHVDDGCYPRYAKLLKYARVLVDESGANDLSYKSAAQHESDVSQLWSDFRAGNANTKIVRTLVLPRTNSNDGYASESGQTSVGDNQWNPGGAVDVFNAWVPTKLADNTVDYVLNFATVMNTSTGTFIKWKAPGQPVTADGVHPNVEGNRLMAVGTNGLLSVLNAIPRIV